MKKSLVGIVIATTISVIFNSCTEKEKFTEKTNDNAARIISIKDLIGKTYEWEYKEATYQITLKSDSTIHWKLIKGIYPGPTEETDKYVSSKIDDHKLFISWVENSGLGVHSVVDFKTMNLYTQGSQDGHLYVNPGTIKEIE